MGTTLRAALVAAVVALCDVRRAAHAQTVAPTPYPTMAVTTGTPTMAPITLQNLCTAEDAENFEANLEYFDFDLGVCGLDCSYGVVQEQDEIQTCVRNCLSRVNARQPSLQSEPYTSDCGECFGAYADCMVRDCDCTAARDTSGRCRVCSLALCEADFTNCTGGFVIPEYYEGPEEELDVGQVIVMASVGGGIAFIVIASSLVFVYRRSMKRISASDKAEIAQARELRKDAKAFGGRSVPPPEHAVGHGPRVFMPAVPSASSVASAPAKLAARMSASFARPKVPPQVPTRDYSEGLRTKHANPVGHTYRVHMPFVGKEEDELTVRTNTLVTITEVINQDCVAVRVNGTGQEGILLAGHLEDA